MNSPTATHFKLEDGSTFAGVTPRQLEELVLQLQQDSFVSLAQICEAAGVSAAMVLRVALGLSASGAVLTAVVGDSRAGYITLSALRQLANAGSSISVFTLTTATEDSLFGSHLMAAHAAGITLLSLEDTPVAECLELIENAHAVIFGLYGDKESASHPCQLICKGINELQTPVHALEIPPGLDAATGEPNGEAVFAATTIVPGLPLAALATAADFAGRLYLCDISVPRTTYKALGEGLENVFVRQPVNQIFVSG